MEKRWKNLEIYSVFIYKNNKSVFDKTYVCKTIYFRNFQVFFQIIAIIQRGDKCHQLYYYFFFISGCRLFSYFCIFLGWPAAGSMLKRSNMCATNSLYFASVGRSTGTTRVDNRDDTYLHSFAFGTTARKQAARSQPALAHCASSSKCVTFNVCRWQILKAPSSKAQNALMRR